jgi:hypothetical protein
MLQISGMQSYSFYWDSAGTAGPPLISCAVSYISTSSELILGLFLVALGLPLHSKETIRNLKYEASYKWK